MKKNNWYEKNNSENKTNNPHLGIDKSAIRSEIITQCKLLDLAYHTNAADAICAHASILIDAATTIAIYHARSWEMNLGTLIKSAQKKHKKLYQPIAYKDHRFMRFETYDYNASPLFAVADYIPSNEIPWYNLDLIFMPLVAVDKIGTRLGNGGGYYDTTLSEILKLPKTKRKTILCGVGFSCQMLEILPREDWDIPLDYFVSENGLYKFMG